MSQHNNSLLDTASLANAHGAKVAIVYTEWNEEIISALVEGCERVLNKFRAGVVYKGAVPGAFELPFACRRVWEEVKPDVIIAFGTVIRGGTPHFDYVCQAVTDGITQLNVTLPIPVIFGVLTLDNEAQAWERLGGPHGHKGEEAAITALKMTLFNRFEK